MRRKAKISLIICSRNRGSSLQRCLGSLQAPEILETSVEVILVDNGSTDETHAVMAAFAENSTFPVEVVTEPEPGLGRARNAGLSRAAGEIIVFTDDDCYLEPGYLMKTEKVFEGETFHYCGGRILLFDPSDAHYACDEGEKFELISPYSLIPAGKIQGANMVIHRKVLDRIGLFDPMFGAGTPFRCEDIDYCARASFAGFTGAHVPELVVHHHHGRKPGPDFENLNRDNDYAWGAYYTKFIFMGKYPYLRNWVESARYADRTKTLRQVGGAIRYLYRRAKNHLRVASQSGSSFRIVQETEDKVNFPEATSGDCYRRKSGAP